MFAILLSVAGASKVLIDPVSHNHLPEIHHSLHAPLDKSQVYWKIGGATVMTKKFIRLIPDTQDRRGWIWNDYPLESTNWEVEVKFSVHSKPHFGGDGFAVWVLASDHDPTFSSDPDALSGPTLGMRADFQGFGVLLDVYDNDGKRNNPLVFVLKNFKPGQQTFNHDDDYTSDMVKDVPTIIPGHFGTDHSKLHKSHQCMADVRNSGRDTKMLIKYLHKVLHVYIDHGDSEGYRFCLAVTLDNRTFVDYHLAFSGATGQVADNVDIREITTRYLAETDEDIDDTLLEYLAEARRGSIVGYIAKFLIVIIALLLFVHTGYDLFVYYTTPRTDAHKIAASLNRWLREQYCVQLALVVLCLIRLDFVGILVNGPLLLWRGYHVSGGHYKFTEGAINGVSFKGHGLSGLSAWVRLWVTFLVYAASTAHAISNLF